MWGAIKSDLLSFVTTITEDTTNTINRVLGEEETEEEDVSVQEKLVADLRRSFETYSTPIRDVDGRDYEKFKKKFNLSSCAADIARVLDEEPEVSRFYAELVPISMSPEEFWGRLFFRINQIYRNGAANLDEDDEEELVWEEEEEFTPNTDHKTTEGHVAAAVEEKSSHEDAIAVTSGTKASSSQTAQPSSAHMGTSTHVPTTSKGAQTTAQSATADVNVSEIITVNEHMKERVVELEQENRRLLTQEEELFRRIQELEAILAAQSIADAAALEASSATTTPQSKRSAQKSSAPATTPPTAAYYNTTTPPTAAPSANASAVAKKKGSTAKKLFDSPSQQSAPATAEDGDSHGALAAQSTSASLPSPPAQAATVASPVASPTAPVSVPVTVADYVSLSSEESGVVVNKSDANSVDDEAFAHTAAVGTLGASGSPGGSSLAAGVAMSGASPAKSAFSSNETAKYLAALDDQDDEEDGWN